MPNSVLRNDGRQHQSQPVCRLNYQELGREEMQREGAHSHVNFAWAVSAISH